MKKHEYKKPDPIYIKDGGLPITLVGIITVIAILFLVLVSLNFWTGISNYETKKTSTIYKNTGY